MNTYWFFDSAIIKKTQGALVIPGRIRKFENNPLFREGLYEQPSLFWEPRFDNGYPNVFYDPLQKKYRCYYTGFVYDETSTLVPIAERSHTEYKRVGERITGLLYAESPDGIKWTKPFLGITEFGGTKENNILGLNIHGASILLDLEDDDPGRRYKLIARDDTPPRNIFVSFSEDGIHFGERIPIINDWKLPGDTHNFVLKDNESGLYVFYTRMFSREIRTVARLVSEDFIHWHDAREIFRGTGLDDQIYAMPVFKQGELFFGLADVFHGGDESLSHHDHVDVELCYSADGIRWQRVAPGLPLIPNGAGPYGTGECDAGCCYASVPTDDGEDYRFYYMGGNGAHYSWRETGLCCAKLQKNRLAGVTARDGENFVYQTRTLSVDLSKATVCADIDAGGCIEYELLDTNGNPVPGFSAEQCVPITSSCDQAKLQWKTIHELPERCMIRFYCYKSIIYLINGISNVYPTHQG